MCQLTAYKSSQYVENNLSKKELVLKIFLRLADNYYDWHEMIRSALEYFLIFLSIQLIFIQERIIPISFYELTFLITFLILLSKNNKESSWLDQHTKSTPPI